LIDDVSTFWFGDVLELAGKAWTQVTEPWFLGEDSAMAFTWQGIALPAGGTLTKSVIVRFGGFESSNIVLSVAFPRAGEKLYCLDTFKISGVASMTDARQPTGKLIRLFLEIDADSGLISEISGGYRLYDPFTIWLIPAEQGIRSGSHQLTIYAVDADGNVSPGKSEVFDFAEDKTASGVAMGVVVAIGVVGGLGVLVAVVLLVRCLRRRKFGKPEEISSAPPVPGAEPLDFLEDQLLPD
jgi:hypothetical protein